MSASATTGTSVNLDGVCKTFLHRGETVAALQDVSLSVDAGEFLAIVGPSGCGKSTLLNIVAGLDEPDDGTVWLDGSAKGKRLGRSGYMPQKDLLLPWRTVLDNVSLGLELTGTPGHQARLHAGELLERFGLRGFGARYPAALSGGMRQRAAFLRTVLTGKPLLLLDEPFGALDALTRRDMQEWLLDVWSAFRQTVILITHDVEEAILLADRIAVMTHRPGTILLEREIDLPRPRSADLVSDDRFVRHKAEVLQTLRNGSER